MVIIYSVKNCQNNYRNKRNHTEVRMFLINQSLCFQVLSLVAVLALSALSMPVYEEHQQIEEHHYVSTQTQYYPTRHRTQTDVLKNC